MPVRWRSYLYVGIQFTCLALIAVSGPLIPLNWPALLLILLAGTVGVWAILVMRPREVSVFPDVRDRMRLVTIGPYRLIRHPMYTAVILGALGLVLGAPTLWRWAVWLVLLVDLLLKLHYEEQLLCARFAEYAAYQARSWRLIPFVY
jgi:protein-S-isoprenylcysteine O-methyltransferase Ste14